MEIGIYKYDPKLKQLQHGNESETLTFKAHAVLMVFINNPEKVITREYLIENIWEGNFLVGDKALTQAIWMLRKHLIKHKEIIETVPKKGYVFHLPEPEKVIFVNNSTSRTFCKPSSKLVLGVFAILLALLSSLLLLPSNSDKTIAISWEVDSTDNSHWKALSQKMAELGYRLDKLPGDTLTSSHNLKLLISLDTKSSPQTLNLVMTSKTPSKMQSRQTTQPAIQPTFMVNEVLALMHAMSM